MIYLDIKDKCFVCPHPELQMEKSVYKTCTAYVPVITNADRIRSMSDEELASKISNQCISSLCDIVCGGDCKSFATLNKTSHKRCVEIVLEWLHQPTE